MMLPHRDEVEAHRAYLHEQQQDPKWLRFDLSCIALLLVLWLVGYCA